LETEKLTSKQANKQTFRNMAHVKIHQDPTVPVSAFGKSKEASSSLVSLLQRQPKPLDENQVQQLMNQGFTKGESVV
jgi:hypothetical protein